VTMLLFKNIYQHSPTVDYIQFLNVSIGFNIEFVVYML
jgi:hypothetical protein